MKRIKNVPLFIICLVGCQAAGIIGSLFTVSSIPTWYASLTKPSFSPPNWVFGPVWTTLYLLMGISLYIILTKKTTAKKVKQRAVKLFIAQLLLNSLWSILFFGLKNPQLAFFELLILWGFVFLSIKSFYTISKSASYMLFPYLAWITFAGILNFYLWILNK